MGASSFETSENKFYNRICHPEISLRANSGDFLLMFLEKLRFFREIEIFHILEAEKGCSNVENLRN